MTPGIGRRSFRHSATVLAAAPLLARVVPTTVHAAPPRR